MGSIQGTINQSISTIGGAINTGGAVATALAKQEQKAKKRRSEIAKRAAQTRKQNKLRAMQMANEIATSEIEAQKTQIDTFNDTYNNIINKSRRG